MSHLIINIYKKIINEELMNVYIVTSFSGVGNCPINSAI